MKVKVSGMRIDKYLKDELDYSREVITKMLKEGKILVNGKEVKPSYKVKLEDDITIIGKYVTQTKVEAEKMPLNIVYEDDDLMVINKPSGQVVHPGSGNHEHTLVSGLLYHTQNLSHLEDEVRPGIVHRLDKDTSGLMLVAKSNKAHEILAEGFKNKTIHREYVALLSGVFPSGEALIDAPIGRDKNNYQKMCINPQGKKAITHLKVIKKYAKYTLVRLKLDTGRTHQIRVHMAYIGYPVFNDPVYNPKKGNEFGQFLHSEYLKFTHPITGEVLEFRVPLPSEFQSFLDKLEQE